MASAHVRQAVKARLTTAIGALPYIEIGNEPQASLNKPDRWLSVDFPQSTEALITIGGTAQQIYRERGSARVNCIVRTGAGEGDALTDAELVRDLFRGAMFEGIYVSNVDPADSGPWLEDGAFYHATVTLEYQYDRFV